MRRFLDYNKKLKQRAQEMRKNMTAPEKKLWYEFLRNLTINKSPLIPLDKREIATNEKSSSILLDKEEVATNQSKEKVPLIKGEVSDSEQGDCFKIKVLRQRSIGNFIVDFYIPEYKIVIEID
jgi:very-short-patch-repair endonuclease